MNAPSTVGIAIPAYGRGHELSQTLESALSQTRPADDIVVVDDCSPDSTEEVARSFAERGVRYARNARNLGVPENLNNALRMLSTDYVMILEDHDCLAPHFIEKCVGLLDANPEMVIAFTAIADAGDPTRRRREYRRSFPGVLPGREIARQIVTTTHAPFSVNALIRRSALLGLEPYFDPRYWWYADLYLWVRLALRGTVGYVPDPLLLLRDREPGHYLTGREWKTLLVCHQLRQDCWSLVFPSPGPESWIARARYQLSRDRAGIQQVVANISHGRPAGLDSPDLELRSYFSPVGWHLARLVSRLPTYSAVGIRRIYRRIT